MKTTKTTATIAVAVLCIVTLSWGACSVDIDMDNNQIKNAVANMPLEEANTTAPTVEWVKAYIANN